MKQPCAHDGCSSELPDDENKIPPGWTVARVEEYGKKTIKLYYLYICPTHTVATSTKQTQLFADPDPRTENAL